MSTLPRRLVAWLPLPLAAMLLAVALWVSPAGDLEAGPGLALLYGLRGHRPPPESVVIVTLDSESARRLSQPERPDRWDRTLHARLIGDLAARGAAVIGMDLLFERDRSEPGDAALAAALARAGNVVLAEGVARDKLAGPDGRTVATTDRLVPPLSRFATAAAATAPYIMAKTPQGIFEYWPLLPSVGDQPALPLLMARRLGAADAATVRPGERRTLNLYGPPGSIRTLRYPDALATAADPAAGTTAFAGKAVLIGFSEFNQSKQSDAYPTPYTTADGVDVSGVELCATALANLLDGSTLRRWPDGAELAMLLVWSMALAACWLFATPWRALAAMGILLASYGFAASQAFAAGLWLPTMQPLVLLPAAVGLLGLAFQARLARRRALALEQAIDLGITRRGVERLQSVLGNRAQGRTVAAVCLCSDIVAYTPLSESLGPRATRDALNRYFALFIPIIEAHGGYVTDIVGDSVMSLWLAEPDATEACDRARQATLELDRIMNRDVPENALSTRFGLHYGPVFLGEVGAGERHDLRPVGDVVNTASRIQGANKYLGTRVLMSGDVAQCGGTGSERRLGRFVLVGKARPLELHELAAMAPPAQAAADFARGRDEYAVGRLAAAAAAFAAALEQMPDDGPSSFYLRCCSAPPAGDAIPLPGK